MEKNEFIEFFLRNPTIRHNIAIYMGLFTEEEVDEMLRSCLQFLWIVAISGKNLAPPFLIGMGIKGMCSQQEFKGFMIYLGKEIIKLPSIENAENILVCRQLAEKEFGNLGESWTFRDDIWEETFTTDTSTRMS